MHHAAKNTRTGVPISDWTPDELKTAAILRTRQEETVSRLLEEARTPEQLEAAVNLTSDTAEAMALRIRNPASPALACDKGCSWCCNQLVCVTAPEAFRIVRYLNSPAMSGTRDGLITRLRNLDKVTRGMSAQNRTRIPKSCAFLGVDGRCTIYAVRPMACAEFTSYDEAVCKRALRVGQDKSPAVHEKARMIAYFSVREGMIKGMDKALPGTDTSGLELTAAVVTALDHADAEAAWLEGEPVMKPARMPGGGVQPVIR